MQQCCIHGRIAGASVRFRTSMRESARFAQMHESHTKYVRLGRSETAFKWTKLIAKTINELLLTLLAACTTRVQYPRCGLTIRATPRRIEQKPQKSTTKHEETSAERLWKSNLQFHGRSSPVVARTPPQVRKGICQVAEQSLGTWNIHIHAIVFE